MIIVQLMITINMILPYNNTNDTSHNNTEDRVAAAARESGATIGASGYSALVMSGEQGPSLSLSIYIYIYTHI